MPSIVRRAALAAVGVLALTAQQPIAPPAFAPFGDGRDSVLMSDLEYRIGDTAFVIKVPAGFVTDFASTPRIIWSVLPPFGRYQMAAVVHDFLYWDQGCTREEADHLLLAAMVESNVGFADRNTIYWSVRDFGQSAWDQNAADRARGLPRIIPRSRLPLPPLVTWGAFRAELFERGEAAATAVTERPSYCTAASSVVAVPMRGRPQ